MTTGYYKVPLTTINKIEPHPNADRLEIATVYGFQVVVGKGTHKVGDDVIYIPIESIIPPNLEAYLFPEGSKIKLSKSKVRQIRIRKFASQGMLVSLDDILGAYIHEGITVKSFNYQMEVDLSKLLNIHKYEPPIKRGNVLSTKGRTGKKNVDNPKFGKYGGINNIKWNPNLFAEGEIVHVTEKLHGTNAKAAIQPMVANTWLKKLKKLFGMLPKYQNCYGSNNVQLQNKPGAKGYYGEDVYGKVFNKIDIFDKLSPGETVYGEIIGEGIQKNYNYGCRGEDRKFVVFDVKVTLPNGEPKWLDPDEVSAFCHNKRLEYVPTLYSGPFNLALIKDLTKGNSVYYPKQPVREGVVIRPLNNYDLGMEGRKQLKMISEKYLDKDQSEFH